MVGVSKILKTQGVSKLSGSDTLQLSENTEFSRFSRHLPSSFRETLLCSRVSRFSRSEQPFPVPHPLGGAPAREPGWGPPGLPGAIMVVQISKFLEVLKIVGFFNGSALLCLDILKHSVFGKLHGVGPT